MVKKALPPDRLVNVRPVEKKLVEVTLVKLVEPETDRLVEVIPPVTLMFEPVIEVRFALVEVRLVKIPVLGVVLPIGVLLIEPPLMVRASTTIPSVIEFTGKVITPLALKFVVVKLPNTPLVEARLVVKKLVEVSEVPKPLVKLRPEEKRLVEVALDNVVLAKEVIPVICAVPSTTKVLFGVVVPTPILPEGVKTV